MNQLTLTVEQQFKLQVYSQEIEKVSLSEAKQMLVHLLRQSMVKDNIIRDLLRDGK